MGPNYALISNVLNRARAEIARCVASAKIESGEWTIDSVTVDGASAGQIRSRKACPEAVTAFLALHAPPVYDPFCGGGSIPLEAQRLGLRAFASDLNPVAVLITKALIEIPPKFAGMPPVNLGSRRQQTKHADQLGVRGLAEDVRYYGRWMRDEAQKRIGHLYPKVAVTPGLALHRPDLTPDVGQELMVVAWLWARTVASPNPATNGAHVPLVRSFWLCTKQGRKAWVEPLIDRVTNKYHFEIRVGTPDEVLDISIQGGTKLGRGCKFRCILTDQPIPEAYIKSESVAGRLGDRLLAVVAEGSKGRVYLSPTFEQESVVAEAVASDQIRGLDAPLAHDLRNLWCLQYGLDHFHKLFTRRQLLTLTTFSDLVAEARVKVASDATGQISNPDEYAEAVATYLLLSAHLVLDISELPPRSHY